MARAANGLANTQWRGRLERWCESGQSPREFCQEEGVSLQSFYLWRKRLGVVRGDDRQFGRPRFVPVQVIDPPRLSSSFPLSGESAGLRLDADGERILEPVAPTCHVEVWWPTGVRIRFSSDVAEAQLRLVLRVVAAEARSC